MIINVISFMRNLNNLTYYKAYKSNILRDICNHYICKYISILCVLVFGSQNALPFGSCLLAFDSYCKLHTRSKKVHLALGAHHIFCNTSIVFRVFFLQKTKLMGSGQNETFFARCCTGTARKKFFLPDGL